MQRGRDAGQDVALRWLQGGDMRLGCGAKAARHPCQHLPGIRSRQGLPCRKVRRCDESGPKVIAVSGPCSHHTGRTMSTNLEKVLQPDRPPGRADRKALEYSSEIRRLRRLGYTFTAIRRALESVGVHVGLTTVRREANRKDNVRAMPAPGPAPVTAAAVTRPPTSVGSTASEAIVNDRRTGKDLAEEFFRKHHSNPLIRARNAARGEDELGR